MPPLLLSPLNLNISFPYITIWGISKTIEVIEGIKA